MLGSQKHIVFLGSKLKLPLFSHGTYGHQPYYVGFFPYRL